MRTAEALKADKDALEKRLKDIKVIRETDRPTVTSWLMHV